MWWHTYRTLRIIASMRNPFRVARDYQASRGMDLRHDWRDWLGGFPYEYASAGEVFSFCRELGFELVRMQTTSTVGCNELNLRPAIFRRAIRTG